MMDATIDHDKIHEENRRNIYSVQFSLKKYNFDGVDLEQEQEVGRLYQSS